MSTSPSPAPSPLISKSEYYSSLPWFRRCLAMLNWRPVRGIELEIEQIKQRSQRNESEAEQRMKQIEERTTHIESETEQFKGENASEKTLSALIKQHCFPPECSSTLPKPTEPDCGPSSP